MQQMTVQLLVDTMSKTQSKPELESTVSPMKVTSEHVLLCTSNLPYFLSPLQRSILLEDFDNFALLMPEERDGQLNSEYQLYQLQMNTIPPQAVDKDSVIRTTQIKGNLQRVEMTDRDELFREIPPEISIPVLEMEIQRSLDPQKLEI
jgi:hypothetical protein